MCRTFKIALMSVRKNDSAEIKIMRGKNKKITAGPFVSSPHIMHSHGKK